MTAEAIRQGAQAFALAELARQRAATGQSYLEFLSAGALSAGLYVLPVGAADPQTPHAEDELYYVIAGRASFSAGALTTAVSAGTVLFVPARLDHRFHDITEALEVLVLFAPAEGSGG